MTIHRSARRAVVILSLVSGLGALAHAGSVVNGAPALIARATDLGKVDRSTPIDITVWLKLRDGAGLDDTLAAQRAGTASMLSAEQIQARYAPATADVAAVKGFLTSKGLAVTDVGPHNLFVRASGTAGIVQSALGVELHRYNFKGTEFRAGKTGPTLPDAIAPLVASVGGLNNLGVKPNVLRAGSPANLGGRPNIVRPSDGEGLKAKPVPLSAAGANGLVFSAQCFYPPTAISFSGDGATAFYEGNVYGANINNTAAGTVAPCAYQPSELQTAYNLTPLYADGLDGRGETIAIVDAYGSITVQNDLATFSQVMGLPPAKLFVVGKLTESGYSGDANSGWADETTLDVEWVHAIAPGAKIVLVVAPTNSFDDLFAAIAKASTIPGVVSISNSWSGYESGTDVPLRRSADQLLKIAGAKGQSVNFATGDEGNETYDLGYVDVNFPASSPYATGVGGVSVGLNSNHQINFQTSWGNNITELFDTIALGSPPIDPPLNEGFLYGGGGGTSNVYPLPYFQHGLGGQRRLLPDISWVADPYTGVEIIETLDASGDQYIESIGGTSLATPMFSALWGIATQRAGHPLGQAAPYLYDLPSGALFDIAATPTSPDNVSGVLIDANGRQIQTPWDLALPLQGQQTFFSALYNSPYSTRWFVLTFGNDSTLQAGPGWDPATGVGTPNAWNFVQAFAHR
jgi:subtilase family serine protease